MNTNNSAQIYTFDKEEFISGLEQLIEKTKSGTDEVTFKRCDIIMEDIKNYMTNIDTIYNTTLNTDVGTAANCVIQGLSVLGYNNSLRIMESDDEEEIPGKMITLFNDTVFLTIHKNEGDILCDVSFGRFVVPISVCEITSLLKDIFMTNVLIDDDMFVIDPATHEYAWGEEEISLLQKRLGGRKVSPVIIFDNEDGDFGNC